MTLSARAFTLAALLSTAAIPAFAETPDDQLVVGFSMTNVLTLDPAAITGREPVQILANVYDGLVSLDAMDRAKVNPDLAESWEVAPDDKSITFHLREGATFASGNPVTAEDVVWSLNRLMTLNLAQASFLKTHGFTADNAAASFTAPDAKTVVVTLPKPVDPHDHRADPRHRRAGLGARQQAGAWRTRRTATSAPTGSTPTRPARASSPSRAGRPTTG